MACIELLAALGAAISGCAEPAAPRAAAPSDPAAIYQTLDRANVSVDPAAMRDMLSIYRRNKGLITVAVDPQLQREAAGQAAAMAKANSTQIKGRGRLAFRLEAAHFKRAIAVENVSAGYHTLAEAFSGWRQSGPHNSNMLNPGVRRIGIATAYAPNTKYKVFWAMILTD